MSSFQNIFSLLNQCNILINDSNQEEEICLKTIDHLKNAIEKLSEMKQIDSSINIESSKQQQKQQNERFENVKMILLRMIEEKKRLIEIQLKLIGKTKQIEIEQIIHSKENKNEICIGNNEAKLALIDGKNCCFKEF